MTERKYNHMKLYATIEAPASTQKIYVEGNAYFVCTTNGMKEFYGSPEIYIRNALERASYLNMKLEIKR